MSRQPQKTSFDIFPRKLREAMAFKGWTQKMLEEESGISQGTISNYLRGKRDPSSSQLHILAECLGVRMEWLLVGEGERSIEEFVSKLRSIGLEEGDVSESALHNAAREVDSQMVTMIHQHRAETADQKFRDLKSRIARVEKKLDDAKSEIQALKKLLG